MQLRHNVVLKSAETIVQDLNDGQARDGTVALVVCSIEASKESSFIAFKHFYLIIT